jgi:hypothetical protein
MDGAWSTNREKMNTYRLLVGNREGKRSLGRPRRRRVYVRMAHGVVRLGDVD